MNSHWTLSISQTEQVLSIFRAYDVNKSVMFRSILSQWFKSPSPVLQNTDEQSSRMNETVDQPKWGKVSSSTDAEKRERENRAWRRRKCRLFRPRGGICRVAAAKFRNRGTKTPNSWKSPNSCKSTSNFHIGGMQPFFFKVFQIQINKFK